MSAGAGHDHHHGHGHGHGHGHDHDHQHAHTHVPVHTDEWRLRFAFLLTALFMVAEAIGGLLSGSLALLADAGHMLSDTFALGLALFALRFARRPADTRRSYGYRRAEVLAAFTNGLVLVGLSLLIAIEAVQRFFAPEPVAAGLLLAIAALGLLVNVVAFAILQGADRHNLNIRGAALHVFGDLLGSLAAIAAGLIILTTGWMAADPLLSLVVVALILRGAVPVIRSSAHILLEGTPRGIDARKIADHLRREVEDVEDVHHVHVWSLDGRRALITLHVALAEGASGGAVLARVQSVLAERFGLEHATVQIEERPCDPCPEEGALAGEGRAVHRA